MKQEATNVKAEALLRATFNSYYNVYDKNPKAVALEYLLSLESRFLATKEKRELPCFQPHAMGIGRTTSSMYMHTGLLQLDIDWKDNQHLESAAERQKVIDTLIDSDHVLSAQTSAGGYGVWALLPTEGISLFNHKEIAEEALLWAISLTGLAYDEKVTNNVASLRFLSCAEDMKINSEATPFNA